MKPKQHLFELVKSLTSNEKRYFKLYCSLQKGNKNYLKLFNEIDSRKEYNEAAIKSKFKNEKFTNQLSFTKNYLYKLIIQSLISYEGDKPVDMRITKQINAGRILLSKGLIRQYTDILDHALKISTMYERFNLSLQILELKDLYTKIKPPFKNSLLHAGQIESEIKKIENYHSYNSILKDLIELYRSKGKIRSKDLECKICNIETNDLLKHSSEALSFRALENFYFIKQIIADFRSDYETVFKCTEERLKIITKHPEPFADLNVNHIHDILGYMLSYFARRKDSRRFNHYMKRLESLPVKNRSDEVSFFFLKTYVTNVKIIADKDWKQGESVFSGIKEKLDRYKVNVEGDMELLIRYQFITILIMNGNNKSALGEVNQLLTHPKIKLRSDMEWCVRLLAIIIHFQIKNFDLMRYLILSTKRYLYKKNNLFRLEKILLEYIHKLSLVATLKQQKHLLVEMRNKMLSLKNDTYEKNAFRYFDFLSWTEQKINELNTT